MTTTNETTPKRVEPNPYSPYATADPDLRHMFVPFFGGIPDAGVLALAECERQAVVPADTVDCTDAVMEGRLTDLPPGLCPVCITVATGQGEPGQQHPETCRRCEGVSSQGEWCAMCRFELHEEWWANTHRVTPEEDAAGVATVKHARASMTAEVRCFTAEHEPIGYIAAVPVDESSIEVVSVPGSGVARIDVLPAETPADSESLES